MTATVEGDVALTTSAPDDAPLDAVVDALVTDKVASRIAAQDPTLWGTEAESEAAIRLAWVDLAERSRPLIAQIDLLREALAADGVTRVVLAGMGGSSLAPEVITATAAVDLVTLDTTDVAQTRAALTELDRTVLVVSSKSGSTVETDTHRRLFEQAFRDAGIDAASRIVVVTDPGSPLAELAEKAGYRAVFHADPHVGGRYSALTAFGLVPAGLAGANITQLLDDAATVSAALAADSPGNPAVRLGALLGLAHRAGAEKVVLANSTEAGATTAVGFGDWVEQLIAESTGKDGKGLLPVVVESVDAPGFADAGSDAVTITMGVSNTPKTALSGFGAAVRAPLGAAMLLWEYAVAVAGRIIGINPFDQPDVESAKAAARQFLDRSSESSDSANSDAGTPMAATVEGIEFHGPVGVLTGANQLTEVFNRFLALTPQQGYIAIQAYLDRLTDPAPQLRALIAERTGHQTTFGWGPRFLHSTGQYHKGGWPNGVFIQLLGPGDEDLDVPNQPYTLGELQLAQAHGDASVLRQLGRPVLTVTLTDRQAGLAAIAAALG